MCVRVCVCVWWRNCLPLIWQSLRRNELSRCSIGSLKLLSWKFITILKPNKITVCDGIQTFPAINKSWLTLFWPISIRLSGSLRHLTAGSDQEGSLPVEKGRRLLYILAAQFKGFYKNAANENMNPDKVGNFNIHFTSTLLYSRINTPRPI